MMGADFPLAPLESYLRAALLDVRGEMRLERISGGQSNPTFFLEFGNASFVLRKQPPGELLPSAHAIDREYRVQKALAGTGVPVPQMVLYCEDRSLIGTPFYLMHRVPGRVFHQCALAEAAPETRRAMYRSLAHTLAALHNVEPESVGLGDYGRREGYFSRQIGRWTKQWGLTKQAENADVEALIQWLPTNIPPEEFCSISHGDYRLGNVLFSPDAPEVSAVLDWELSTLGHPLADLAHCCIAWHATQGEYGGIDGVDRAALGLPEQTEFESWYGEKARHGLRLQPFHMAFALFRFAIVFEGIAARAKAGNANDANAANYASLTGKFAARAVKLIQ